MIASIDDGNDFANEDKLTENANQALEVDEEVTEGSDEEIPEYENRGKLAKKKNAAYEARKKLEDRLARRKMEKELDYLAGKRS